MIREFDPEVVEQMRTAYNHPPRAGRPKRLSLSFDELLDRFSLDCNTFTSIGIEAGVSRERIRQVYNKYFRILFGSSRTGHARRKVCSRIKWIRKRGELLPTGFAAEVALAAQANGKTAKAVARKYNKHGVKASSATLVIGNSLCVARRVRSAQQYAKKGHHQHYHLHVRTLSKIAFLIVETPAGFFVIPSGVFSKLGSYYIPAIPPSQMRYTSNSQRRIDFWKYHEAWTLIP